MNEYKDLFNPYFLTDMSGESDGWKPISALPKDPVTTMSYVPFQEDSSTYEPSEALKRGTLFPDLDKPFYGRRMMPK